MSTYNCRWGYLWQSRKKMGSPCRCPKCNGKNILNLSHFQPSPIKYPGKNMFINRWACGYEWQTTKLMSCCPKCSNTEITSIKPAETQRTELLNKVTNPHLLSKIKKK